MSWFNGSIPDNCRECRTEVELVIVPRTVDIGGFKVHRALPFQKKQMVGPFIFWDQVGPGGFAPGHGVDVRPHPHIGLSTLTYLFDGSLDHKDSLGNKVRIVPGDLNLMHAGRGVVHSERTGPDVRQHSSSLFGIQSWLAQPRKLEESEPFFSHFDGGELPIVEGEGVSGRVILGQFEGYHSPVEVQWETLYLQLSLNKGRSISVPTSMEERAIFTVTGRIAINGAIFEPRQMIVLQPETEICVEGTEDAHFIILGGASLEGPRYIWWNFVSSSLERIKSAADDWQRGKFAIVPDDEEEFIPLPDLPFPAA